MNKGYNPFFAKSRHKYQKSIRAVGKTRSSLEAALSNISIIAVRASSLSVIERIDLTVDISRESELQQVLQIDSRNPLRPSWRSERILMASKIESTA